MEHIEVLANMRMGAEISSALPAIEEEVTKMQKGIVNSVLTDIQNGKFTPEVAYQRWIEYSSATRLLQRFNQKVRVGVSVGEQHTDEISYGVK